MKHKQMPSLNRELGKKIYKASKSKLEAVVHQFKRKCSLICIGKIGEQM